MSPFQIRKLRDSDLRGADELRRLAGWNQTTDDWRRLLLLSPDGCFVAVEDGSLVGTVTTTSYGRAMAWIGMMLVHPERRGNGIGTALMHHALKHLQLLGVHCVRLDATPAGRPIYQKLGFVDEWSLRRWERRPIEAATQERSAIFPKVASETRALTPEDWPQVELMDSTAFGVNRIALLRALANDSLAARVYGNRKSLRAWGLLRPGVSAAYLGPVACYEPRGGAAVIKELLQSAAADCPVYWDIPDLNVSAIQTAEAYGFAPVRPLTRMRLGPATCTSDPLRQVGIADPAVG